MRTWYKHRFGKLDQQDIQVVEVYGEFEQHEQEYALACGWAQVDGDVWQQLRTVRINIETYVQQSKKPKTLDGVEIESITGAEVSNMLDVLKQIYAKYLNYHNYTELAPHPLDDIGSDDMIYLYRHNGELVGFSVWSIYGLSLDNWQMAWNYATPKLQLGKYSLWYEINEAYKQEKLYFYLGASYDASCRWKSSVPGFEWWDGERWQTDVKAYNNAIDQDVKLVLETPSDDII